MKNRLVNAPNIKVGSVALFVDIAETPEEKARGLSGRPSLGEKEGMLFVFKDNSRPVFWMKDMLIPLDFIWIAQGKVIYIQENIPAPESGTPDFKLPFYEPPSGIDYVLEVNAGFVRENNIKNNDLVKLSNM